MQGEHPRVPLLAVILATLAACATGSSYKLYPEGDRPPMAAKEKDTAAKEFGIQQGLALVYLYRPGTEPGALMVHVDNAAECELWAGNFFVISLKPGAHKINAVDVRVIPPEGGTLYAKKELTEGPTFTAEPSKNYYVKVSPASFPLANVELAANEAEAQADIRRCGLITSWKYIKQ